MFSEINNLKVFKENGVPKYVLGEEISAEAKKGIVSVLFKYSRITIKYVLEKIHTSEKVDTLDDAMFELMNYYKCDSNEMFAELSKSKKSGFFYSMYTPCLFDLVETQFDLLPVTLEKHFQKDINKVFLKNNLLWEMQDGMIIQRDRSLIESAETNNPDSNRKEDIND